MNVEKSQKFKLKSVIKWVVIILLTLFAYAFSLYQNGFKNTNLKLLTLLIFSALGFLSFFIFYYLFCAISISYQRKKQKKQLSQTVNCDEKIVNTISDQKYSYSYNAKISVKENFASALSVMTTLVGDIANMHGKKGKYALLDFTVYDALNFVGNCIDGAQSKVDGMFKFIEFTGIKDKPIPFVEKTLTKLIDKELNKEKEIDGEQIENAKKSNSLTKKIADKFKSVGGKVAVYTFKGVIENTINDVIRFVGAESFRVFSNNSTLINEGQSVVLEQDFKEV